MAEPWFFDVLPCRPAPHPDECLSGYLLRLAEANGFGAFWDLAADLFPRWSSPHQVTRLRWEHPVEDWRRLTERTHLPVNALRRLTVAPWVEKFRPPLDHARAPSWSPGAALRGILVPHLQVCPLCLQAAPYLRLLWRLAGVSACVEHGCLLQAHCRRCGRALSVVAPDQHHLRCAACQAELCALPVVPAPSALLATQAKLETGLRYLLDPERRLVPELPPGSPMLPVVVGLKFRYLRVEDKRTVAEIARHMGTEDGQLAQLERGAGTALALYPGYLAQFNLSWPEFAGLHVPADFAQTQATPRHLPLRRCPTVDCPHHASPASLGVRLLADLPERRAARFRCGACGRNFTRGYDGALLSKPRKPVIQPGDPPTVPKPAREIARLKAMGLQGEPNRRIAQALGWGEKTVRMYWIALGLETRVHQAQARWRAREQKQRQAARRARVEVVLQTLLAQDEEITLARVARAMGLGSDYLGSQPNLARRVKAVAKAHNARLRQRRYVAVKARLAQAIEQMQQSETFVKVAALVRPTGLTYDQLQALFPDLFAWARDAARTHRARWRLARLQARSIALNAAAARLVAHGHRLTYGAIAREAHLSPPMVIGDPILRDLLHQWVGGFAPHD